MIAHGTSRKRLSARMNSENADAAFLDPIELGTDAV
jgi:hypothetical protein